MRILQESTVALLHYINNNITWDPQLKLNKIKENSSPESLNFPIISSTNDNLICSGFYKLLTIYVTAINMRNRLVLLASNVQHTWSILQSLEIIELCLLNYDMLSRICNFLFFFCFVPSRVRKTLGFFGLHLACDHIYDSKWIENSEHNYISFWDRVHAIIYDSKWIENNEHNYLTLWDRVQWI